MTTLYFAADDPLAVVATLQAEFPGASIWFGEHTRHFWAMVYDRFIEADRPEELARRLDEMRNWEAASRVTF